MMRFRQNCWGRHLFFLPSTIRNNFCFCEIRIFENCMSKQIFKLTNMYLFWKWCVWEIIDEEEIYCARLAQFGTIFVFEKFAFLKIVCLNKFWNWQICIYFENDASERWLMRKIFIVLALHNSAQLLFFQKNKMAVLVKNSFFQNCSPDFDFFQKSFAAQFSTNLAQFSTTFVFLKKQNGGANFLVI